MKQGLLYTIIFTFIICFLFVFILAFVNERVTAQINRNQKLELAQAVLNAMQISYNSDEQSLKKYSQLEIKGGQGQELYIGAVDGTSLVAKVFTGSGLWGTITGVIAVQENFTRVVGLQIISQNETPGLGGRISEPWFTDQLKGERIVEGTITIHKPQGESGDIDKDNGAIDGITGATRTSDSMQVILHRELTTLKQLLGASP